MDIFHRSFEQEITVCPLGDIHIEHDCDIKRLEKDLEEIEKNGYYTLLIGDIFDVGFLNNIKDLKAHGDLNTAMEATKRLLNPIKDRILGMVDGNHDIRVSKAIGFDIIRELASDLNIPYSSGQAILDLHIGNRGKNKRVGRYAYSIALIHGWGGGRTAGAKANKITQFADMWEGIDLFVMGHVHSPMSMPSARYIFDSRTGSFRMREIRSIVLGAYQNYTLYAEQIALKPSPTLKYLIKLASNEKNIEITERSTA